MIDVAADPDLATDLKGCFFYAKLWFLEKWEMYGVNPMENLFRTFGGRRE
jgi:hypothetical protein